MNKNQKLDKLVSALVYNRGVGSKRTQLRRNLHVVNAKPVRKFFKYQTQGQSKC
jgi:hypothetical protein